MTRPTVAYQGMPGAFGEQVIRQYWGYDAVAVGVESFSAVARAVACGAVRYGVLPVWNSTIGRIASGWAVLADIQRQQPTRIRSIDEVTLPVELCLMARRGVFIDELRVVMGHPAALAQARGFLSRRALRPLDFVDSAGAAMQLGSATHPFVLPHGSDRLDPMSTGAIAPAAAAALYELAILEYGVQDRADNRTSFVVLEGVAS